jgi:hypothetical protein
MTIHYNKDHEGNIRDERIRMLCGHHPNEKSILKATKDRTKVTCKSCIKKLEKSRWNKITKHRA